MKTLKTIILSIAAILLQTVCAAAVTFVDSGRLHECYTKREVMIPMRDGVKLSTAVYEPVNVPEGGSPVIMTRTPYGLKPYGDEFASDLGTAFGKYAENGYIIIYQSVRGTYLSEGEFVNVRPVGETGVDDATDTYDTIEWILSNCSTNGRVGVKGVSYPGFYATISALCGHPALKAVSPQAPVTDWFMGDDFHHNGELMLLDTYSFGGGFLPTRKGPGTGSGKTRPAGTSIDKDVYSYFLEKGTITEVFKPWADSLVFWNDMRAHQVYDEFWELRNPALHFTADMPAAMFVGGLYDTDDCYGPLAAYRALLKVKGADDVYLVEGPWNHGGWRSSRSYLEDVEYPFFAYYLEEKGVKPAPVTLLASSDTDFNLSKGGLPDGRWETMSRWPELDSEGVKLYLNALTGKLDTKNPLSYRKGSSRSYVSDPRNPVPYSRAYADGRSRDKRYMNEDQSWTAERGDVLCYRSAALTDTVRAVGPVKVSLKVSQSTRDAAYIVKICDEFPDGRQMLVRFDVMPARFARGFDKVRYVKKGRRFELNFNLNDIAHYFMPGHRITVLVQSSSYPVFAMNPQNAVKDYYRLSPRDYKESVISIHDGSYIELPVTE